MKSLVLVAAMGLASVNAYAVDIVGLYNTGASFAAGEQDTNYALASTSGVTGEYGYVSANGSFPLAGNWLANTATSSWLTPTINQGESLDPSEDGLYTWTMTFDLTGYNAATASFNAQFAADNTAVVYLNGNQIGTSSGFSSWSTFSASAGHFVAGLNTLSFEVINQAQGAGNPTGLRVEFLSSNVAAVPEADSYSLMMAGLGLMGLVVRRKKAA